MELFGAQGSDFILIVPYENHSAPDGRSPEVHRADHDGIEHFEASGNPLGCTREERGIIALQQTFDVLHHEEFWIEQFDVAEELPNQVVPRIILQSLSDIAEALAGRAPDHSIGTLATEKAPPDAGVDVSHVGFQGRDPGEVVAITRLEGRIDIDRYK